LTLAQAAAMAGAKTSKMLHAGAAPLPYYVPGSGRIG